MKNSPILCSIFILVQIQWIVCFIDPVSIAIGGGAIGLLTYMFSGPEKKPYERPYCDDHECCDDYWIPQNVNSLQTLLRKRLHGQQIAHGNVVTILRGQSRTSNPPKALTMSFHGLPGSGKNFVTNMIANTYFKKGTQSSYYHFFNGRTFAPDENALQKYQEDIKGTIVRSLEKCSRSMFVFDEVDMMPHGLLNVLVPFLDYVDGTSISVNGNRRWVRTNRAIFIFLSNTGSQQIMDHMMKSWLAGVDRNTMTLKDFENLIAIGAFNEKGGFEKSETIRTNLIDHYVPFLPLEEQHVKLCMADAFSSRLRSKPTKEMEDEVLSVVTYGPEPHNIYSKSGCKKIEQKVISTVYQNSYSD